MVAETWLHSFFSKAADYWRNVAQHWLAQLEGGIVRCPEDRQSHADYVSGAEQS
ncbi:hypothetical protein [Bradyrhizobium sp. B117]|uniref:hypothetical protein n=1 Tax=Bradyrhizobium sp. B117 TaxID=3140246 RepID=UPI0031835F0F